MTRFKVPLKYRYLTSYILVMLIPLLIIGFIVYTQVIGITKEKELQNNANILEQIQETVDSQFRNIISISHQLSQIPGLKRTQSGSIYDIVQIRNVLNFSVGNEFIRELVYYSRQSKYMVSAQSTYNPALFYQMFINGPEGSEAFEEAVNTMQRPEFVEESLQGSSDLIYMIPLPLNGGSPKATVVYILNKEVLHKQYQSLLAYKDSNSYILDRDGKVLFAFREGMEGIEGRLLQAWAAGKPAGEQLIEGKTYLISSKISSLSGFSYVTIVPKQEVLEPVYRMIRQAIIATVFVILIGFAIIYVSMRYNYHPLRKLIKHVEIKWGTAFKDNYGIDKLTAVMTHAEALQEQLQSQTERVGPAMREHLLSGLVRGKFASLQSFNDLGETVGLQLSRARYFVAILACPDRVKLPDPRPAQPTALERYEIELLDSGMKAWLIGTDEPDCLGAEWWQYLHDKVTEQGKLPVTIGVGGTYEVRKDLRLLSKSFIEAITAYEYKVVKGGNRVIHFSETSEAIPAISWYPNNELESLELHIRDKNEQKLMSTALQIVDQIEKYSTSLYMAKYLSIEMMNRALYAFYQLPQLPNKQWGFPDVIALSRMDNLPELKNAALQACEIMASELRDLIEQKGEMSKSRVIADYLQKNALSYLFSVQKMSDDLGISKVHLGRVFKEHAGVTITEYVHQQRLDKAKSLLKQSDWSIQDIVEQIGYTDVSSFIRKFKQEMGVTPGEYRKLHQQEITADDQ